MTTNVWSSFGKRLVALPGVDALKTLLGITGTVTVDNSNWSGTDLAVDNGGTGRSLATAYAVICGGTTNTGAHQSIASVGTSTHVLTSNGAGALPTFQPLPAIDYGAGNAALSFGAIGTYALLIPPNAGATTYNFGDTLAGSSLDPVGFPRSAGTAQVNTTSPSGTWRCMGHGIAHATATVNVGTLWMRIS